MSNKTRLQTNNTSLQSLIDKANALPDAGSSEGGFISNKLNGATIDATGVGPTSTSIVYSYDSNKTVRTCMLGEWSGGAPYSATNGQIYHLSSAISATYSEAEGSVNLSVRGGNGYNNGIAEGDKFIIFMSEDNTVDMDFFHIKLINYTCFLKGTKILLSNGTTKEIQNINYNDDLLVWDFDNGCYTSAKPLWIKKVQIADHYYKCTFEDGSTLNLVGSNGKCHRVFSVDTNTFEAATDCVNSRIMTKNGITTLLSCEKIEEEVEYYNIITNYHMNLFAEGVLTSCRLNNLYQIKDMKFVKEERENILISEYGNIDNNLYHGLRLSERKEEDISWINDYVNNINSLMVEKE